MDTPAIFGNREIAALPDMERAKKQGARIEPLILTQQPKALARHAVVQRFPKRTVAEALPLILVDGAITLGERYPNRSGLACWAGIVARPTPVGVRVATSGCDPKGCCQ